MRRVTRTLLLRERGFSVALLAPDGAGKSTLAKSLRSSMAFGAPDFWSLPREYRV